MLRFLTTAFVIGLIPAMAQAPATPQAPAAAQAPGAGARPPRPQAPARDPSTPGYVTAKDLTDGAVPPINADGNFILGPTHSPAPEMTVQEGVPQGRVVEFTMESTNSK